MLPRWILFALGALMIVATLLPLLPWAVWWVRVFDFPRVQVAAIALLVLLAYLALVGSAGWSPWQWLFVLLLAGCIVFQAVLIYPFTPLAATQVKPARLQDPKIRFSLMSANVLMYNRRAEPLLEMVERLNPDLLLTLEVDSWWTRQLAPLRQRYPYAVLKPQDNTYGMALYSRLELRDPQVRFLVQDDVPSIHAWLRLRNGAELEFYGVHPKPPAPAEHYRSTERDAELLLIGRAVRDSRHGAIVIGDLNDVAWSHTTRLFGRISRLLDPRVGRGVYATFHASYPLLLRWPLDHVFFSDELRLVDMRVLPGIGSDHFPIHLTLSYEPEHSAGQDEPERPDGGDRREAAETIGEALEDNGR